MEKIVEARFADKTPASKPLFWFSSGCDRFASLGKLKALVVAGWPVAHGFDSLAENQWQHA